jgi:predicted transcriptional regulator
MSKSPTPAVIIATRESVGLTQEAAAALIDRSDRAWRAYEAGHRELDPILWQVWRIRAGLDKASEILGS